MGDGVAVGRVGRVVWGLVLLWVMESGVGVGVGTREANLGKQGLVFCLEKANRDRRFGMGL